MEDTLRDPSQLVETQCQDPWLRELWSLLEAGWGEDSQWLRLRRRPRHLACTPRTRVHSRHAQAPGTRRVGAHPWHVRAPGSGTYSNLDRAEIPLAYPQAVHPRVRSLLDMLATEGRLEHAASPVPPPSPAPVGPSGATLAPIPASVGLPMPTPLGPPGEGTTLAPAGNICFGSLSKSFIAAL